MVGSAICSLEIQRIPGIPRNSNRARTVKSRDAPFRFAVSIRVFCASGYYLRVNNHSPFVLHSFSEHCNPVEEKEYLNGIECPLLFFEKRHLPICTALETENNVSSRLLHYPNNLNNPTYSRRIYADSIEKNKFLFEKLIVLLYIVLDQSFVNSIQRRGIIDNLVRMGRSSRLKRYVTLPWMTRVPDPVRPMIKFAWKTKSLKARTRLRGLRWRGRAWKGADKLK